MIYVFSVAQETAATSTQIERPMSSDNKRPAQSTTNDGPPSKVPATAGGAATPTDAQAAMGLTGTGAEQASGGASSDGQSIYVIERPMSIFGRKESVYKKCHKFMTFGFATANLQPVSTEAPVYQTSFLAEIPWHIPALYLTPGEFELIPNGSHVKSISVEVIYRGSTIQFETNASSTGLATLNQINNIGVAEGLNLTGWGSNISFASFNATQPMIPATIKKPKYAPVASNYRGMVRDYYGSPNGGGTGAGERFLGDVPKHQVGGHTFLYNYWANSSRTASTTEGQYTGWPCLAEKYQGLDGKTCTNQVVLQKSYNPKVAPIKTPLYGVGHGMPFGQGTTTTAATLSVPVGGQITHQRTANLAVQQGKIAASEIPITQLAAEIEAASGNISPVIWDIYSPIEKSQVYRTGFWGGTHPDVQPSVHVGVCPVPALSSSALLTEDAQFNQWTDTRAYWEVNVTMVVSENLPTAYPYATTPNIPWGDVMMQSVTKPAINVDPRNDGATFCSLYTTASASSLAD